MYNTQLSPTKVAPSAAGIVTRPSSQHMRHPLCLLRERTTTRWYREIAYRVASPDSKSNCPSSLLYGPLSRRVGRAPHGTLSAAEFVTGPFIQYCIIQSWGRPAPKRHFRSIRGHASRPHVTLPDTSRNFGSIMSWRHCMISASCRNDGISRTVWNGPDHFTLLSHTVWDMRMHGHACAWRHAGLHGRVCGSWIVQTLLQYSRE